MLSTLAEPLIQRKNSRNMKQMGQIEEYIQSQNKEPQPTQGTLLRRMGDAKRVRRAMS